MKKRLLFLAAFVGLSAASQAQTVYYSEDFESTTGTSLPTGWTQTNAGSGTGVGWSTGTNATLASTSFNIPAHTRFVGLNDDMTQAADNTNSFLKTGTVSLTGASNAYLKFDLAYLGGTYQGASETLTLEGSTDGGTTWSVIQTIPGNAVYFWETKFISVPSSYNGMSNVKFGFRYKDGGGWLFGAAVDNFEVYTPAANELALVDLDPSTTGVNYGGANGTMPVAGTVVNYGSSTVTSFNIDYQLTGGSVVTTPITGVSIAPFTSYNFTATTLTLPATTGDYTLTAWVDQTGDADLTDDTLTSSITVADSVVPKMVLVEEFNQASCDPCAAATPNVDSVIGNNLSRMNAVRYHVNFPGRDFMDSVTYTPFVGPLLTFYGVNGVPDAKIDGDDVYPGAGSFTSALVSTYARPTPFRINVTANYNTMTNTYTVDASMKSFVALPAGLVVKAALTVDTITYALNQSTESIPQYSFPQVAENMFPNANGSTLTAFTSGQTQTMSLSWVKNHPWASHYDTFPYDSTSMGHITVWVQDPTSKRVYQSESVPVNTQMPASVSNIAASINQISIFPNPATEQATLRVDLKTTTDLNVTVLDAMGRVVYSVANGSTAAGQTSIVIPTGSLASGLYNVKVQTGTGSVTERLNVVK